MIKAFPIYLLPAILCSAYLYIYVFKANVTLLCIVFHSCLLYNLCYSLMYKPLFAPFFPFFFFWGHFFRIFASVGPGVCGLFHGSHSPVLEGLDLILIAAKILVYVLAWLWQTQGKTTYLQKKNQIQIHFHLSSLPGNTAM